MNEDNAYIWINREAMLKLIQSKDFDVNWLKTWIALLFATAKSNSITTTYNDFAQEYHVPRRHIHAALVGLSQLGLLAFRKAGTKTNVTITNRASVAR